MVSSAVVLYTSVIVKNSTHEMNQSDLCLCHSGATYAECCGPCHLDHANAKTAQQLMRSRYVAYALKLEEYLLNTWHRSTRPANLNLARDATQWIKLKIVVTEEGTQEDSEGRVGFEARYRMNGRAGKLRELSSFTKEDGLWYYVSGGVL